MERESGRTTTVSAVRWGGAADPEQGIPETVQGQTAFGLQMIVPAHCTGWRAVTALVNTFGDGVVAPTAVGKHYAF
jgi:7,8-dihydropterin-6-yl-methyl-4-(beta-D-ribofuranosyl)aminobenzene 5'-phosphate synthase